MKAYPVDAFPLSELDFGVLVELLRDCKHAVERETLRIDDQGCLSKSPHPSALGSPLTHPYITTDFSEAQLELVTPPCNSEKAALQYLDRIHRAVYVHLDEELLWPCSAPAKLPAAAEIPLAQYGSSMLGEEKLVYRRGLSHRYGSRMQTYSGIHYNCSFSPKLWEYLQQESSWDGDLQRMMTEGYLHLSRNFLRMAWLTTYLFGATPIVDKSLFDSLPPGLQELDETAYYHPYATSLRMSRLGYYSKVQAQLAISYDSLDEYIHDLHYAITTPSPKYRRIGVWKNGRRLQLNECLLQIEAEHYSRIRPKPKLIPGRGAIESLRQGGVSYVEVRAVDLDPQQAGGIGLQELQFLHTCLLSCLLSPSPSLELKEKQTIAYNQNKVAVRGRDPRLRLKTDLGTRPLREWAQELLEGLKPYAGLLDAAHNTRDYSRVLEQQQAKVNDDSLTPSAQMLTAVTREHAGFLDYGLDRAEASRGHYSELAMRRDEELEWEECARQSLDKQQQIEHHDDFILAGYEDLELSTQMLIREAQRRGIQAEVLDRYENVVRFSHGRRSEVVEKATMTSKDSLITYLLLRNKYATKLYLSENGISTPQGTIYRSAEHAAAEYDRWKTLNLVVKPNFTNYGIGVHYVKRGDRQEYIKAVKEAMKYGSEVIVEEEIRGKEYRFLVIGDQTVAVCRRLPANVIGDGVLSISQLIEVKNHDPKAYKLPKYFIRIGEEEAQFLREQGLSADSIPEKGRQIFLRQNSNVSTGGDPVDVGSAVHEEYKQLAAQAAHCVRARFCGVDMIIEDASKAPQKSTHSILELNYNPALFLHRYPVTGEVTRVEEMALDELGFHSSTPHGAGR